jgi:hypothetical protein
MKALTSVWVGVALVVAAGASVADPLHPDNSEIGVSVQPNHPTAPSGVTRAQVEAQVMGAQRDGSLTWISRGYPARYPLSAGPALSKSRDQVESELRAWRANSVAPDGARDVGGEVGWIR